MDEVGGQAELVRFPRTAPCSGPLWTNIGVSEPVSQVAHSLQRIFSPRRHLTVGMLLAFTTGGRGQMCCWISDNAQDSPPQQKTIQPQIITVGISLPAQGPNLGRLLLELGVLAAGPSGKSLKL
ncbi:uncharacterized protein ACBT57_000853 [Dama dama]